MKTTTTSITIAVVVLILAIVVAFISNFIYRSISVVNWEQVIRDMLMAVVDTNATTTITKNGTSITPDVMNNTTTLSGSSGTTVDAGENKSFWTKVLQQNYVFMLTGVLGIATSVMGLLYWIGDEFFKYIKKHFVTSVSLNNSNDAYKWLMNYLGNQHTLYHNLKNGKDLSVDVHEKMEARFITAPSLIANMVRIKDSWNDKTFDDGHAVHVQYVPEDGFHMFTFRGKLFWFTKERSTDEVNAGYDKSTSFALESVTLNMFGNMKSQANQQLLMDLFDAAMKSSLANHSDVVKIYTAQRWGGWQLALAKNKRPFKSVILDRGLSEALATDAIQFLKRRDWYREKGIPFRRGYLLYGLPGTGKSSFVSALASRLNLNICVLDLASGAMGDEELAQKMQSAPTNSVILLEDIDAIFLDRDTPGAKERRRAVTFAGLLNSIDGIAAPESGRLLFMTTNHIEKLDPALIRAGRCDVKVHFTHATKEQMKGAFLHFYPGSTDEQADRFCTAIQTEGEQLTMAQILSHLSLHKRDPEGCIANVQDGFIKRIRQYALEERNTSALPIEKWLKRLGLARHVQAFKEQKIRSIFDLEGNDSPSALKSFGIKAYCDAERVKGMLGNNKKIVNEFQLITPAEVSRTIKTHLVNVPDKFIQQFLGAISGHEISFLELKRFLNEFKQAYYTCSPSERTAVLVDMLNKIDRELLNPPSYHLKLPTLSDMINIHTGMPCTEVNETVDLYDYMLSIEARSAKEWITELNSEYKWWDPNNNEAAYPQTEEVPKDDQTKDQDNEKPESLSTIFEVLDEEGIETVKDLLAINAQNPSTWKDKFHVKVIGRTVKIARRFKEIKKQVDKFASLQKKWAKLFELSPLENDD